MLAVDTPSGTEGSRRGHGDAPGSPSISHRSRAGIPARWLRIAAALLLASLTLFTAAVAVAVADRIGPLRPIVNELELRIGPNDELHYQVHTVLGRILSFCPCTAGLSRDQYGRAAYHRPRPAPSPSAR
jgi:hypothetical protein